MTDEQLIAVARARIFPAPRNLDVKLEDFQPYAIREAVIVYFGRPSQVGSYEIELDRETGEFLRGSFSPEDRQSEREGRYSLERRKKKRNSNDS